MAREALAQDAVVVVGARGERSIRRGEVLDHTGESLTLRLGTGQETTIDSKRIVEIQTSRVPAHVQAEQLLRDGKFREAAPVLARALQDEKREWVRRQILARQVTCYQDLGQPEKAIDWFLKLLLPDTLHFGVIPLAWEPAQPSPALESNARDWIRNEDAPAAALIGASWLLATQQRGTATQALQRLASNTDPHIAFLAEAQLWRTKIVTATASDTRQWQQRIDRMPSEIRFGPYLVLGQCWARLQEHELAALALMRLPVLYPQHYTLAGRALLLAARELEASKQPESAAGLYRELLADYAESPAADAARNSATAPRNQPRNIRATGPEKKRPAENPLRGGKQSTLGDRPPAEK